MIHMQPFRVLFLATAILTPALLFAQALPDSVLPSTSSLDLPSSQMMQLIPTAAQHHNKRIYSDFFAGAGKHPLTPRDVAIRETVRSLGVDQHRFVRCDLLDGSSVTGGILLVGQESFQVSQGIQHQRRIFYADLKTPPKPVLATPQHFLHTLEWTGIVVAVIAAAPFVIVLSAAGVFPDC